MIEQPPRLYETQPRTLRMPTDKQPNGKPFTPALSANFRHIKSPLTPRLAGSAPNSPASAQRQDAFVRTRSPAREEHTPALAVTGNITPRTAARRSRIGTESPATPASSRDANVSRPRAKSNAAPKQSPPISIGLGIASPTATSSRTNLVQGPVKSPTPIYTVPRRKSGARSAVQNDDGENTKFFRAEDASKSYPSLPGVNDKAPVRPNDGTFFYVGGTQAHGVPSPKMSPSKQPLGAVDDKFFHASEVRAQSAPKSRNPATPAAASRPQLTDRTRSAASALPAHSPHKPSPPPMQALHTPLPASPQKATLSDNAFTSVDSSPPSARRTSIGSNFLPKRPVPQLGHKKSMSASSLSGTSTQKTIISRSMLGPVSDSRIINALNQSASLVDRLHIPPSPETLSPRSTSLTSSNTVATSLNSEGDRPEAQKLPSSTSPDQTIAAVSSPRLEASIPIAVEPQRPVQDDASNARRERKVLDLEISNSSLLAINKTLERELRKQTVELRRFRRLSRSGRFSIVPTDRAVSGSTLGTVAELNDEDDSNSEQDDESDFDAFDEEDILSNDSSSMQSPTSKVRQRARDEKRLMLDLSKHQQILLDSQKLTQSIRRCLTCTEELIRDGNKAVEYRVGIGDVKLGGRVLTNEDLDSSILQEGEEERPQRQRLLSPSLTSSNLTEDNLWITNTTTSSPEPEQERESVLSAGVERLFAELLEA